MATVLNGLNFNQQPLAPGRDVSIPDWWNILMTHAHANSLIVTQVSLNKQSSAWPGFQHEYVTLEVNIHPSEPQHLAPVTLVVSRNVQATLGLWGPSLDTVTIRSPEVPVIEVQPYTIQWQPNNAPLLRSIFILIHDIHSRMLTYCLLKMSCYTFARAILEAINSAFNGQQDHPPLETFFMQQSYFLGCIPVGITRAHKVADEAVATYQRYLQLQ